MFYFMLGNITPSKRSKLKGIQLLAICKHTLVKKYGMNEIIKPIVKDIKSLVNYSNSVTIINLYHRNLAIIWIHTMVYKRYLDHCLL